MDRPRLLDLFCGAGGAAVGYRRAGFDVTGVDNRPQKNYPFAFIEADALEYVAAHGHEYDAIHASPPCQRYSRITPVARRTEHPDLIAPTRAALTTIGRPWVIENVDCAPIHGITLCGVSFGLDFYKHRRFESSALLFAPPHIGHPTAGSLSTIVDSAHERIARALGIDWMLSHELRQAIPPAYTEFIGAQLLSHAVSLRESAA